LVSVRQSGGELVRKVIVALLATGILAGPLGSLANAGVYCTVLEKAGVNWVKECEDPPILP
jgi:hypothetical protein